MNIGIAGDWDDRNITRNFLNCLPFTYFFRLRIFAYFLPTGLKSSAAYHACKSVHAGAESGAELCIAEV